MNLEINAYQNSEIIANSYVKVIRNCDTFSSPRIRNYSVRSSSRIFGIQLRTEIDLTPPMHLFDIREVLSSFEG